MLSLQRAEELAPFWETLAILNRWMFEPVLMWNDDNVDSAQMCSETHVRNHDISCLRSPRLLGGHPGESGAILSETSWQGQQQMLGKRHIGLILLTCQGRLSRKSDLRLSLLPS